MPLHDDEGVTERGHDRDRPAGASRGVYRSVTLTSVTVTSSLPGSSPPLLLASELAALDRAVDAALASGRLGDLRVVGFGEISLVIAWPSTGPDVAVKLAACAPGPGVRAHASLIARYCAELGTHGVPTVPTQVVTAPGPSRRGYLL